VDAFEFFLGPAHAQKHGGYGFHPKFYAEAAQAKHFGQGLLIALRAVFHGNTLLKKA
jgi:hypothetical protein